MRAHALVLGALLVQVLHAHCPRLCDCRWKGGKESVLCPAANLTRLPARLDPGTQLLDLSDNPLAAFPRDAFLTAGLLNLQKVYAAKCRLRTIDRHAFRKLSNLVELDLSHNLLAAVPSHVFDSIPELRELKLSGNPLQRVLNEAFVRVPQLVRLELSDCRLGAVEPRAFSGLESTLEWLKLDKNRLADIRSATLTSLQSLHGLELAGNPWNCTCGLRPLREWMLRQNVPFGMPPACRQPPRLAGRSWERMELDEFACAPEANPATAEARVQESDNVTLSCRVGGEPEPRVVWLLRNRVLGNASAGGRRSYALQARGRLATLTLLGVEPQDAGLYSCAAENLAGRAEGVMKLTVVKRLGGGPHSGLALVAGATAALLVLAACLLLLGLRAARGKPRPHPAACARRSESYEKIEMNHKVSRGAVASTLELEADPLRSDAGTAAGATRRRGDYRHVPSQDTEDEAETYDEEMETPTPTPTSEAPAPGPGAAWRAVPPWPARPAPKLEDADLHIPRLSDYRESRVDLTPDSSSSCGQYSVFESQNKANNNSADGGVARSVRQLAARALQGLPDEQNNLVDPDKNYPDLLEVNSNSTPPEPRTPLPPAYLEDRDNAFCTLPRRGAPGGRNNNRPSRETDSQSPLLPESRYGSSGGESGLSSSNRRLSAESYSNGNGRAVRSNSFLNLAAAPSLPGSPASATPLLEIRGLPRKELTRAPLAAPAPSLPLAYDYHAAQLERFLEEYRSLQEQLCRMKETCENIGGGRERSGAAPDEGRAPLAGRPSVAVTASSAVGGALPGAASPLAAAPAGLGGWAPTPLLKRLGGSGDFFRS